MAITSSRVQRYALGRECVIEVEGNELKGVSEVLVRESVSEIDGTGFNHACASSIVTLRSYEIQLTVPDQITARWLNGLRGVRVNAQFQPYVVDVSLDGGIVTFVNKRFTIHDIEADEPLDGIVAGRFTLKQCGH